MNTTQLLLGTLALAGGGALIASAYQTEATPAPRKKRAPTTGVPKCLQGLYDPAGKPSASVSNKIVDEQARLQFGQIANTYMTPAAQTSALMVAVDMITRRVARGADVLQVIASSLAPNCPDGEPLTQLPQAQSVETPTEFWAAQTPDAAGTPFQKLLFGLREVFAVAEIEVAMSDLNNGPNDCLEGIFARDTMASSQDVREKLSGGAYATSPAIQAFETARTQLTRSAELQAFNLALQLVQQPDVEDWLLSNNAEARLTVARQIANEMAKSCNVWAETIIDPDGDSMQRVLAGIAIMADIALLEVRVTRALDKECLVAVYDPEVRGPMEGERSEWVEEELIKVTGDARSTELMMFRNGAFYMTTDAQRRAFEDGRAMWMDANSTWANLTAMEDPAFDPDRGVIVNDLEKAISAVIIAEVLAPNCGEWDFVEPSLDPTARPEQQVLGGIYAMLDIIEQAYSEFAGTSEIAE
jgi:hypothetical protein